MEEVEQRIECWRYALKRRGMNRPKTKYLCINGGNDDKTAKIEDTKVPRVKEFKYLGLTVQESGSCERKVMRRVQAGWNGWIKVSGVICDRRLPARVKGKVYSSVVTPAMVYWDGGGHKETNGRDESCRDENVEVCYGSDEKRQD